MRWTYEQKARLLACETDEQMTRAFPDLKLSTLKGYKRKFAAEVDEPLVEESRKDKRIAYLESQLRKTRRLYKVQSRESAEMDEIVEAMRDIVPTLPPVTVQPPFKPNGKINEESAVLVLSDIHYGEVVDEEETGGISAYNRAIAARRLDFTVKRTIKMVKESLRGGYSIDTLYVFGLGDFVSGIIHDELRVSNELGIIGQVMECAALIEEALLTLCQEFQRVIFVGVSGNHGRTTEKYYFKGKQTNNYDYLCYKMVEKALSSQPNLEFVIPKSFWAIVKVENTTFCLTHGDTVRSWGGIPAYGLIREYLKFRTLAADFGHDFQHLILGHFHNTNVLTIQRWKIILNGSLKGGDEYSIGAISAATDPTQLLFGVHPDKGITWSVELNSAEVR